MSELSAKGPWVLWWVPESMELQRNMVFNDRCQALQVCAVLNAHELQVAGNPEPNSLHWGYYVVLTDDEVCDLGMDWGPWRPHF